MPKNFSSFNYLLYDVVDGMTDWVRVIDKNNTVLYANKKMCADVGRDIVNEKCYTYLRQSKPCQMCISRKTIDTGEISRKEVFLNDRVYEVISSPVRNEAGEIFAAVEVFRDITYTKKLTKEIDEKNKKMSNDINFAKNIQNRMLPPKGIYNGLKIDYVYEPSEMLSGDIFDVYNIDDKHTLIYICDVVGHGVSSSLLTIFVRQTLRTLSKNNLDIGIVVSELHKMFLTMNLETEMYFSVFCGLYNRETKEFSYTNAGHNTSPILIRNDKYLALEAKGLPICSIVDNIKPDVFTMKLRKDDKILFYTDGIVEVKNENKEEFGENRIMNIIRKDDNILENIYEGVKAFGYGEIRDDCAVMLVNVTE